MHLLKRMGALALAAALCLNLAACGAASSSAASSAAASSQAVASSAAASEAAGITLTDQAGRTVTLEQPAESIVSCYYISTYATIALGLKDKIVGLENKADTRALYALAAPELPQLTQVGTLKELNVEAVAALEPDLVIMPQKLIDNAQTLEDLGITVIIVNPETQEGLETMLTLIGEACGASDQAQALIDYNHTQLERAAEMTADLEKPSVCLLGNSSYLSVAPAAMYQNDLIEQAGGVNAAASIEEDYWADVSYETLLALAPEVLVIPSAASYTAEDVMKDPQLADLPAVQNGAVYTMPQGLDEWDSPTPSGILGVLWLTSVLHPEAYPFEEFTADAQAFYQTFYGFTPDSSLITK
ncbi:ABC transporter substrate-binding protein [Faecalibacterium gallinarum]|uniref:ABC transporter substrate-binding protein n=1 Tax=Faecalibacterium gallinarum TaxID=2903556 RepID=A0AA37J0J7_9FIRM|nr:ABC transporter substrate-binding protein [Faecalibacterium gallinarum]GJN65675.1 ABC transporter substrate-binding protein [Faecalibacterium gallinarum]